MKKAIVCLLLVFALCLPACAETYTPAEFLLRFGEVFSERVQERLANYDPTNTQNTTEPIEPSSGSDTELLPVIEYASDTDVVTFDGGSIKLSEALAEYEEMVALYVEFGMDPYEYADDLKEGVLAALAEQAILEMKAKELDVYESSAEELAAAEEEALYLFEDSLEYYKGLLYDGTLSDEELTAAAEELLTEDGVTYENILKDTLYSLWSERLYEIATADVTDETLQNMYETGISDSMQLYADDPEMFEYDYTYSILFYRPAGFREVVYMELPYTDEEYGMADEDDRLASLTERYSDIIARAQNGEDIMELVSQIECYDFGTLAINEDSSLMSETFTAAAMALAEGETSQPIACDYGAWIIRCNGEIESGAVPLEEIYDELAEAALESAKGEFYYEQVQKWMDEANIVYYPEMLP